MPATKVTPLLTVESVEDALAFWTDRLGFRCTAQVPHGDVIGFAILQQQNVEVMLQSRASVVAQSPGLAEVGTAACLYIEVDELAWVKAALGPDDEILVPEATTAYGAREIAVAAPGGHVVVFAEFSVQPG